MRHRAASACASPHSRQMRKRAGVCDPGQTGAASAASAAQTPPVGEPRPLLGGPTTVQKLSDKSRCKQVRVVVTTRVRSLLQGTEALADADATRSGQPGTSGAGAVGGDEGEAGCSSPDLEKVLTQNRGRS